ncbi:MAG: hypothetical protein LC715_04115, partial [Gammaproteobacteria bacterium]|nr:hypothetical protein [Gammaproteobacteria bacterium]
MKRRFAVVVLTAAIGTALVACKPASQDATAPAAAEPPATAAAQSAPATRAAAPTDLEQLAQRLV